MNKISTHHTFFNNGIGDITNTRCVQCSDLIDKFGIRFFLNHVQRLMGVFNMILNNSAGQVFGSLGGGVHHDNWVVICALIEYSVRHIKDLPNQNVTTSHNCKFKLVNKKNSRQLFESTDGSKGTKKRRWYHRFLYKLQFRVLFCNLEITI